jgi:plastocyanin
MGYFNVTNPTKNDVDGKDVAITKSISMTNWQANLTKSLQKQDPNGKVITTATADHNNEMKGIEEHNHRQLTSQSSYSNTSKVSIVKGAAALGNKAFLPDLTKIRIGNTVTWTNNDNNLHTVTSGTANTANAGEAFDSGLTALIMPAKTYSHKFTNSGEFPYFCRVHPTMVGKIEVVSSTNTTDNR